MAGPGFRTQSWGPMSSGPGLGFQGSEVAAPLPAHPHLSPPTFQQHWYEAPYGHVSNFPVPHTIDSANGAFPGPSPGRSPYAPGGGYQMNYQHHMPGHYGFLPSHPRLPPAFRSGTNEVRMNFAGPNEIGDTFSRADQSPSHSSQPLQHFHHQAYGVPNPPVTGPRSYHQRFSSMNSPVSPPRYNNRDVSQPPNGSNGSNTNQEQHPLPQSPYRRASYRERSSLGSRGYDSNMERRSIAGLDSQIGRPDLNSSPRSSNRRSFDRYQFDLPQSSTSSDAEEAAARAPPSSRARHRPREVRPRFFGHHQHIDPNLVTPRQLQELKDRLPRRLPSELPEKISKTCDICQKDYANEHVKAAEEEEVAVELPCGHCFGEFCIFEWFDTCKTHKNKVTCPMCRKQLIEPSRYPHALMSAVARHGQSFHDLIASELRGSHPPMTPEREVGF